MHEIRAKTASRWLVLSSFHSHYYLQQINYISVVVSIYHSFLCIVSWKVL